MRTAQELIKYFFKNLGLKGHLWLLLNVALMIASSFFVSRVPLAFQDFITSAKNSMGLTPTYVALITCAGYYLLSSFLRDLQLYTFSFVERAISLNIGAQSFGRALMTKEGNVSNFSNFMVSFQGFFTVLFFNVIPVSLDVLFILTALNKTLSGSVTTVFIVFLLGYAVFSISSTAYIAKNQKKFFAMQANSFNQINSVFSVAKLIQRYAANSFSDNYFINQFNNNQDLRIQIGTQRSIQINLINLWSAIFFILIFYFALREMASGQIGFESLIPIESFFFQTLRRLEIFVRAFRDSANNYANLLNYSPWFKDEEDRNTLALAENIDYISDFEQVTIQNGITLVSGPTGVGKSTFLKYLESKFLDSTDFAVVTQNQEFFNGTILENITLGRSVSPERINQLMKDLSLTSVIQALPLGLSTYLDPKNSVLSGGELQRLAIIRAFCLPTTYMLLDEITSAQDKAHEKIVFNFLAEQSTAKKIVMISHSVSAQDICDHQLIFINRGKFLLKSHVAGVN